MDIADDIAYSTYDLEDAFKAELLTPLEWIFFAARRRYSCRCNDEEETLRGMTRRKTLQKSI